MRYEDNPADYEQRLRAKITPATIRSTMAFAALYQMTGEMTRHAVVDEVRQFFACGFADGQWVIDEAAYREQVLSRDRSVFRASLSWLVWMGAINDAQALRLAAIQSHRNELTHELVRFIIDPDTEPDVDLFTDAVEILKAIRRFWTQVESDIGMFDHLGDVDLDEVVPLSMMILQQCLDAYVDGLGS